MAWGAYRKFAVTMTSGATLTSEVDLGRAWARVFIDPTGAASEVRFQTAQTGTAAAGVYRQVYLPQGMNTATVQSNIWKVASAISGGIQEVCSGFQYMKVETTAAVTNGATFYIICSDC